jgi:hypothetical protein
MAGTKPLSILLDGQRKIKTKTKTIFVTIDRFAKMNKGDTLCCHI